MNDAGSAQRTRRRGPYLSRGPERPRMTCRLRASVPPDASSRVALNGTPMKHGAVPATRIRSLHDRPGRSGRVVWLQLWPYWGWLEAPTDGGDVATNIRSTTVGAALWSQDVELDPARFVGRPPGPKRGRQVEAGHPQFVRPKSINHRRADPTGSSRDQRPFPSSDLGSYLKGYKVDH
jgi:hypothetical protein